MIVDELILKIQNNEVDAFKAVYKVYNEKLYFFALKYCGSSYVAEEVVQQTFIKLWENRSHLSHTHTLPSQIFRIGKSLLLDTLRKEMREKDKKAGMEDMFAHQENGEDKIIYKEDLQLVNQKIESLPPVRKKIFKLSRIDGLSYKEIAQILSISTKTVENHIAIALKQLKNFL